METHIHTDHFTTSQYLKEKLSGKIARSKKIAIFQETFGPIYNVNLKYLNVHQLFDHLFEDSEILKLVNWQLITSQRQGIHLLV